MKKSITISTIAAESGVSVSTVSRVLNQRSDVHPDTRERVLATIEKYGFHANASARSIVSKTSYTIGMVIAEQADYVFMNQYFAMVQEGIILTSQEYGYYVLSMYCNNLMEALDVYRQRRIDGIVLISPTADLDEAVGKLQEEGVPLVVIGSYPYPAQAPHVSIDDYAGACEAVDYLIECGHHRIAHVSGPNAVPSSAQRTKGYVDCMNAHGLPIDDGMLQVVEGGIDLHTTISSILQMHPPITALFAGSDFVAIQCISMLRSNSLQVPEDVSVVGFDGIYSAQQILPKLTTMNQFSRDKGAQAVRLLIRWIESGEPVSENVVLKPALMVGESVKTLK